jgi:hypothetical protein
VVLYEGSNRIQINYKDGICGNDWMNVIGIENSTGTAGIQYDGLYNKNLAGISIVFSPSGDDFPVDMDQDGYTVAQGDCDDRNPDVHPGAAEICGDGIDNDCNGLVDDGCSADTPIDEADDVVKDQNTDRLYFPLLPADSQNYLGLVNSRKEKELAGVFEAYDRDGALLGESKVVKVPPLGRFEQKLESLFTDISEEIAYLVFVGENGFSGSGYCRIVDPEEGDSAVYPACGQPNEAKELYIPQLLCGDKWKGWSTEIAIVQPGKKNFYYSLYYGNDVKNPTKITGGKSGSQCILTFDDSNATSARIVAALESVPKPLQSEDGIIGVVLYRHSGMIAAARLQSRGSQDLVVPYLLGENGWWSSETFYNSGSDSAQECSISAVCRTPDDRGEGLVELSFGRYAVDTLVPEKLQTGSYALELGNQCECLGVSFIGCNGSDFLGGYSISGQGSEQGVFASIEVGEVSHSWSGVALYNPGDEPVDVALTAFDDDGNKVGETVSHTIAPGELLSGVPESLMKQSLAKATHIIYTADHKLFGLLVNYRDQEGQEMLDIMPPLQ